MKIGVLTSSRADFGIYTPLIKALAKDSFFEISIIAFGTHLAESHGSTVSEIEALGLGIIIQVPTTVADGTPSDIAIAYGEVVKTFASFWNEHSFDLVLCLGDRYEMNAAVQSGIPYGVIFAHFHGGEKTLGAIDNTYRHQISLASTYHFTATAPFAERLYDLLDEEVSSNRVFNVGSMSLSDISDTPLFSRKEFNETFGIPDGDFALCTFHPETNSPENNLHHLNELSSALSELEPSIHLVINLPNADTFGSLYREALIKFQQENGNVTLIESFGKKGYFTAMKESLFMLGNSSSGIIEAASFEKIAVNVGDRQKGRLQSGNVIDVPFNSKKIIDVCNDLLVSRRNFSGKNEYVQSDTIDTIVTTLKKIGDGRL